jgi:DNA-binding transcriptional regulator YhcF (GntR family)
LTPALVRRIVDNTTIFMPKPALLLPVPASPPGRVQRVTKESTRDKVYSSLRNAILSGRLHCGERVKEIPLAEELGVSRAILREAMQQLVHEGLLESNSYRGARVIELRPEQIDEIVEARILLEGRAVRLAAERIHNAQREQLTSPLFAMSLLMRSKENRDHHASSPLPRGTHKRLIEAICQGTPNDATRELEAHLTENWTAIRRRVAEFIAREEAEKL